MAAPPRNRKGKDTPSGHWEMAGCPVPFDWGYFPHDAAVLPAGADRQQLVARVRAARHPRLCHASGTTIIAETSARSSSATGKPICYTSIDSVFQIAAHEQHFGLDRL